MKQFVFNVKLTDVVIDRLNRQKLDEGRTKIHLFTQAISLYLDVLEGKAEVVYYDSKKKEVQHVR